MQLLRAIVLLAATACVAPAWAQPTPDPATTPADGSAPAPDEGSADAPPPSGTAEIIGLPEQTPPVGTPFAVQVQVSSPIDATTTGVQIVGNPHLELIDASADDDGVWTATLVAWRPGEHPLTLAANLLSTAGVPGDAVAGTVTLSVRATIANESDPEPTPSDAPGEVRVPDLRPVYAGGALAIALVGLLIGRLVRRGDAIAVGPPPPPPRPAWEVAFERLDALDGDGWLERGEHLRFHELLSEILREYLGRRLGFHGPESTTPEVRAELAAKRDQVGALAPMILALLEDTDLVKFARVSPPAEHSRRLLADARALVDQMSAREIESAEGIDDDVPPPVDDEVPPPVPGGAP